MKRADDPAIPAIYLPLNWDQVDEMQRSGLVGFGGHTHSHVILGRTRSQTILEELTQSKSIIENHIGAACHHFCYPNGDTGDFSVESECLVKQTGFRSSVVTLGGFNAPGSSPFLLRRSGMTNDLRPFQIQQYLSHGDASFRGLFSSMRGA